MFRSLSGSSVFSARCTVASANSPGRHVPPASRPAARLPAVGDRSVVHHVAGQDCALAESLFAQIFHRQSGGTQEQIAQVVRHDAVDLLRACCGEGSAARPRCARSSDPAWTRSARRRVWSSCRRRAAPSPAFPQPVPVPAASAFRRSARRAIRSRRRGRKCGGGICSSEKIPRSAPDRNAAPVWMIVCVQPGRRSRPCR